jgi:hypothetical protein
MYSNILGSLKAFLPFFSTFHHNTGTDWPAAEPTQHNYVLPTCWASDLLDHWWMTVHYVFKIGTQTGRKLKNRDITAFRLMSKLFRDRQHKTGLSLKRNERMVTFVCRCFRNNFNFSSVISGFCCPRQQNATSAAREHRRRKLTSSQKVRAGLTIFSSI